ncbi:MAG: acyltransferase, partial [Pedobacter sp.]
MENLVEVSSKKKVEVIEYLRGFAAFYVVIHHFLGFTELKKNVPEIFHFPFRFGQEIVLLFFLMSGFVIYAANQKIRDKFFLEYLKKRVIRIYPTFILTLILSIIILKINNEYLKQTDFVDLLGNIFMLQDTGNKPGAIVYPFLQNYPLWSLSYEWWFYMLFFPICFYINKYSTENRIA